MTQIRPTQIDAALLCTDFRPFAYAPLVKKLERLFAGKLPVRAGMHQDGVGGVIVIGPHHVLVSQNPVPLRPAGFQMALDSPILKKWHPDAARLVAQHRANVFVTLGGKDILFQPDLRAALTPEMSALVESVLPAGQSPDIATFAQRVHVARLVTEVIADMIHPDLIHWCQSNQIFTPETFAYGLDTRGMTVQVHPYLFSDGRDAQGRQLLGFHAFGAEHLTGHHVIVEQSILNPEALIPAVNDLIHGIHKNGQLPRHGSIVRMKSGVEFLVHLVPADARHPRPYLSVAVVAVGDAPPPVRPGTQRAAGTDAAPAPRRRGTGLAALQRIAGRAALSDSRLRQIKRFLPFLGGLAICVVASQVAPDLSLMANL